jgi:acyl-coenzyme A thioesterase PaaI-like protein
LIRHHELCFGCGQANLFGIQLELERADDGSVRGRFFVKQDHQGPPGHAHGGIVATALDEAMALLVYEERLPALTKRLEVELEAPVPVGKFLDVTARVEGEEGRRLTLVAEAAVEGERVATAKGLFVKIEVDGS